jgi:hypothetical protein
MIRFDVTVDPELLRLLQLIGNKAFPAGKAAFNESAKLIQSQWQGWAMGASLQGVSDIRNPSANLARSIKIRRNAPFDVNIETDSKYASQIQDGTDELDMKTTHPYGNKSRVSEDGIPYLIVPFRWGTPNAKGGARAHFKNVIPQPIYNSVLAFNMKFSRRLSVRSDGSQAIHVEKNYRGQPINRSEYEWGDRLIADGNINGMVRFPDETRKKGSTFFTFRIISAASPQGSWNRPADPPVDVVSALEKTTRPAVEEMIQNGLKADVGL